MGRRAYHFWVYIMANKRNGTLYIGVTNNLLRRVREHKAQETQGFTATYDVVRLVYAEHFTYVYNAIDREKEMKRMLRKEKIALIERDNPKWLDLEVQ